MDLRPPLIDVAIASAFVALVVAESATSGVVESPVVHLVVAGLAMASLAWRRRAPLLVAALVVGTDLLSNPDGQLATLLSLVLVSFTLGAETTPPRSYLGLAMVVVPFVAFSMMEQLEPSDLAAALVFIVGPWTVGVVVSGRLAAAEEAVERAARLEREREQETARAAAEERARIARELHDIVSHSISIVTIQTQAVRRRLGPDHAREAADLEQVESTAREALAEMRRLFGVLRTQGESLDLAPQPGLGELERLTDSVGSGEMTVRLRIEGTPVPLSPGLDLAAYRIAQEGLTNAVRHSSATEACVLVRYGEHELEVEVEDNGRGLALNGNGGDGSGHGLVGIRERVALYGGTVELGPSVTGGLRLAARLPLREAP